MIARVNQLEFSRGPYLNENIPAIITDGLSAWSEQGKWSPEWLSSRIKQRQVEVCVSQDRAFNYRPTRKRSEAAAFSREEMPFAEATSRITANQSDHRIYLKQQPVTEKFPELMESLSIPPWIPDPSAVITNLWFGTESVVQLHYDGQNNFFAQLYGVKTWTVFAPTDSPYLYPYPLDSLFPHLSYVDPDAPDPQRYPSFDMAQPLRFTLKAGELLYLPAFWWHSVRAPSVSISISFWWQCTSMQQYLLAPNAFRNLYRSYSLDRLQSLRRATLAPKGLDFQSTAEILLSNGLTWAAGLLALAAFDEGLTTACSAVGVSRSPGCLPCDLPEELATIRTQLSVPSAFVKGIMLATEIAAQVERGNDGEVEEDSVRALMALTRLLSTEPPAEPDESLDDSGHSMPQR